MSIWKSLAPFAVCFLCMVSPSQGAVDAVYRTANTAWVSNYVENVVVTNTSPAFSNAALAVATSAILSDRPAITNISENVVSNFLDVGTVVSVTNGALTISQGGTIKWQESFGGYEFKDEQKASVTPADHKVTFVTLLAGTNTLALTAPPITKAGECRDLVVCVSTVDDATMTFLGDFTNMMMSGDTATTNKLNAGKTTMLYITEIESNKWWVARQEAVDVTPSQQ